MATVHLLVGDDPHGTYIYFERAIKSGSGHSLRIWRDQIERSAVAADDVLFYVDPGPRAFPLGLEKFPCPTIAYLIDVHQGLRPRLDVAQFFDFVFVAQPACLPDFHARGIRHVTWLPLACDPAVHCVLGLERRFEVGFVGKLGYKGTRRHEVLTAVLGRYRTNDYQRYYLPQEMACVYSQSQIVINASINADLNMRVFEAMAAGALLVTDQINNGLGELFRNGEHFIGYSSLDEAIEKITYFLSHEAERGAIAQRAQQLVLARHTYARRWQQVLERVGAAAAQRPALARTMRSSEVALAYAGVFETRREPNGILRTAFEYGHAIALSPYLFRASARALNARVPITAGALRARINMR